MLVRLYHGLREEGNVGAVKICAGRRVGRAPHLNDHQRARGTSGEVRGVHLHVRSGPELVGGGVGCDRRRRMRCVEGHIIRRGSAAGCTRNLDRRDDGMAAGGVGSGHIETDIGQRRGIVVEGNDDRELRESPGGVGDRNISALVVGARAAGSRAARAEGPGCSRGGAAAIRGRYEKRLRKVESLDLSGG